MFELTLPQKVSSWS